MYREKITSPEYSRYIGTDRDREQGLSLAITSNAMEIMDAMGTFKYKQNSNQLKTI